LPYQPPALLALSKFEGPGDAVAVVALLLRCCCAVVALLLRCCCAVAVLLLLYRPGSRLPKLSRHGEVCMVSGDTTRAAGPEKGEERRVKGEGTNGETVAVPRQSGVLVE